MNLLPLLLTPIVFGAAVISSAGAATITFDSLGGANGDSYSGHSEAGFTVTPTQGSWFEGHKFGRPTPSIFSYYVSAGIEVVNGSTFTFSSVDLADAFGASGPSFSIQGFLGASSIFNLTNGDLPYGFTTVANPFSSSPIDRLVISMGKAQTSSYNIDNIVVTGTGREGALGVPEAGSTLLMLGCALFGCAQFQRRIRGA